MSSLGEEYQSRLKVVADQAVLNSEQISRIFDVLADLTENVKQQSVHISLMQGDISVMQGDLSVIKQDIVVIKGDLRQKVSYDDFTALERRVGRLESRAK
ncbi:MAG: hypothetical protein G01um101472_56 [Parcubacteria group bacterium Gr01-1014_72]|nr:MAG: hypothetical protein G01um101472_56 [Parcubacteria group bacterium Gr01-1014_72]